VALSLTKKKKRKEQKESIVNGKKSLYIRLGCRCDWPNIKPPGWDLSSDTGAHPSLSSRILAEGEDSVAEAEFCFRKLEQPCLYSCLSFGRRGGEAPRDPTHSKSVSQASLSALKQLIILDK
ncbi:unnamed protein product, partial [Brassica oleracea var. botrytis]